MDIKKMTWNNVLGVLLRAPGLRVDREKFLSDTFRRYGKREMCGEGDPVELYGAACVEREADRLVGQYTRRVTMLSAAAGLPGGLGLLATIPADVIQFYGNYLVLAQKLAYLYGWKEIGVANGGMDGEAMDRLTLLAGVGFGVEGAAEALVGVMRETGGKIGENLPRIAGRASRWYPVIRNIGAWLGIKITRDSAAKAAGKAVPLIGGVVSGAIGYVGFKAVAGRLHRELRDARMSKQNGGGECC